MAWDTFLSHERMEPGENWEKQTYLVLDIIHDKSRRKVKSFSVLMDHTFPDGIKLARIMLHDWLLYMRSLNPRIFING